MGYEIGNAIRQSYGIKRQRRTDITKKHGLPHSPLEYQKGPEECNRGTHKHIKSNQKNQTLNRLKAIRKKGNKVGNKSNMGEIECLKRGTINIYDFDANSMTSFDNAVQIFVLKRLQTIIGNNRCVEPANTPYIKQKQPLNYTCIQRCSFIELHLIQRLNVFVGNRVEYEQCKRNK